MKGKVELGGIITQNEVQMQNNQHTIKLMVDLEATQLSYTKKTIYMPKKPGKPTSMARGGFPFLLFFLVHCMFKKTVAHGWKCFDHSFLISVL